MTKEALLFLARAVLNAQSAREASWDPETKRYALSCTEAAEQVVGEPQLRAAKNPELREAERLETLCAPLIGYLNHCAWNDAQSWAQLIFKELA